LQEALLLPPDTVTSLKLMDRNSSKWFPEIERLKNLTHLEMSIGITEIPDAISKFPKLEQLSLKNGNIQKISSQLAKLTELEDLDLFSNKLTEFPAVILELKKLKHLNIGANEIATLPEEIDRLKELENLNMVLTNITTLPSSMIKMKQLYIYDGKVLENKMPPEYKDLFDYMKGSTPN
jgi:Leucine-rich repeat (LRR) protein